MEGNKRETCTSYWFKTNLDPEGKKIKKAKGQLYTMNNEEKDIAVKAYEKAEAEKKN